jgi:phosphatidylserine/phosphatidylglycerophosphate/cardiolipin synthase-like enzyme
MAPTLPSELTEHDGPGYWGISPEVIALTVNARRTDKDVAWDAVKRYYSIQVLHTNVKPEWSVFKSALETLCEAWFSKPLDQTAMFATPETVASLVSGAAYYDTPSGVANVLVQGQDVLDAEDGNSRLIMSKRDLHGYAETDTSRRLLKSLNIIRAVPEGYELNRAILSSIAISNTRSRQEAAYQLVDYILAGLGLSVDPSLVSDLLNQLDVTPPETPPRGPPGCVSVLVRDNSLSDLVSVLFGDDFETALDDLLENKRKTRTRLRRTRCLKQDRDAIPQAQEWPMGPDPAAICGLASRRDVPIAAGWIAEQVNTPELELADQLADSGFNVRYDGGILHFDESYESDDPNPSVVDAYNTWIDNRLTELVDQQRTIERLQGQPRSIWDAQRQRLLEATLSQLDSVTISPTRFIYTIFDPEFHADSYDIDQYVGESPELEREVEAIRQWRNNRPHDADSFADVVPEVLNHPLEYPEAPPHVRIMSPWTNFAVKEYVGLFKRLLQNGVKIDLLFRLPEPHEWSNLKKNLLTRLGDTEGQLELRSYSRYKQYHDHTELRELEGDDNEYLYETGVHAKLFIGGGPSDGNLLAGSANLMENSFYYNPEAGIQTRNPNVVETAIDYFDLVWELAADDRIAEDAYTGETEFRYYPRVYRPQ